MVTGATPKHPYLASALELDPKLLATVLLDLLQSEDRKAFRCGVAVSRNLPALLEAFVRLLRLLDSPDDVAHFAPLVLREIYYRLLTGEQSAMLRQMVSPKNRLSQVLKAIGWIRHDSARLLSIDSLARLASMSPASLRRQVKAVTAM